LPELVAGAGSLDSAASLAMRFGRKVLLLTGKNSFRETPRFNRLIDSFRSEGIEVRLAVIPGEPTPALINIIVEQYRIFSPHLVMAIGGGSCLDAGKAVSAMLPSGDDVRLFLEGVGNRTHNGEKIPFIAVPTTAGTGSEATRNAVLSEVGINGYKRSLRHDNFVPEIALLDPTLLLSCPEQVTLASGLDALTQLMEAYLSNRATPFTDALALPAIEALVKFLPHVLLHPADTEARLDLSYAAYISGVCLANAGLGTVHGFASVIGSMVNIPHGVVCGLLMTPCHLSTFNKLKKLRERNPILKKFEQLAAIFSGSTTSHNTKLEFKESFSAWTSQFHLPRFSAFGVQPSMIEQIVNKTEQKNNPVILDPEEMYTIISSCL
jgi:alcohol dehydrogenase class IV